MDWLLAQERPTRCMYSCLCSCCPFKYAWILLLSGACLEASGRRQQQPIYCMCCCSRSLRKHPTLLLWSPSRGYRAQAPPLPPSVAWTHPRPCPPHPCKNLQSSDSARLSAGSPVCVDRPKITLSSKQRRWQMRSHQHPPGRLMPNDHGLLHNKVCYPALHALPSLRTAQQTLPLQCMCMCQREQPSRSSNETS